jgi:hypothetical protein
MSENQIVESSVTAIINASTAPSGVSDNSPAGSTTCLSRYALIADADQVHSAMYPGSIFGPLFTPFAEPSAVTAMVSAKVQLISRIIPKEHIA